MASILLYTVHDYGAIGIRMLGAYARARGHDVKLCFLGSEQGLQVRGDLPCGILHSLNETDSDITIIIHSGGNVNLPAEALDFPPPGEFLDFLAEEQPDIIGFSGRSILSPFLKDWFSLIRKASPSSLIIAGGFGPTLEPDIYLDRGADCVVRGEGEETLVELASRLDDGKTWSDIPNLVFRENDVTVTLPLRPLLRNLDVLPPQLEFCDGIYTVREGKLLESDPMPHLGHCFLNRGCVGSCSYCSAGHWRDIYTEQGIPSPKYRYPSNDACLATFQEQKAKGSKLISIEDDYFVRPYEVMLDFFARYKREIGLPFWLYLHPVLLRNHPELLDIALDAGLISVSLPVQSADESVNKHVFNRSTHLETILNAAFHANRRFIPFDTHFIDGFMGKDISKDDYLEANLDFIKKLPPFHPGFPLLVKYSISFLRMHLNSPLLGSGIISKMSYVEFFYRAMLMCFRYILNDEEFEALRKKSGYRDTPEPLLEAFLRVRACRHEEYMFSKSHELAGREVYIWGGEIVTP